MDQYQQNTLKKLIDSDPANVDRTDAEVMAWLKEAYTTAPKGEKQTFTSILHDLGVNTGYEIIQAVTAVAASDPKTKFILDLMDPSKGGIDLSHPESVAFIDALVVAGGLTAQQGADLKSVGNKTVSRAENAGLKDVNEQIINKVRG